MVLTRAPLACGRAIAMAVCVALGSFGAGTQAVAEAPSDPILLTISGDFDRDGTLDEKALTLRDLQDLGGDTITTSTIWTDGPQEFTGVWLRALLDSLKVPQVALQGDLTITALNDYSVTLPLSDVAAGEMLLAYARNGAPMSVRDKGPLWIVYPYDHAETYRNEVVYARSIWQLDRMHLSDHATEATGGAAGGTTGGATGGAAPAPKAP